MAFQPTPVRAATSGPAGFGASLTPRQREAVVTAVGMGYYNIPRDTTLRGVAAQMGVSTATVAELLRRAELAIVVAYAATLVPAIVR